MSVFLKILVFDFMQELREGADPIKKEVLEFSVQLYGCAPARRSCRTMSRSSLTALLATAAMMVGTGLLPDALWSAPLLGLVSLTAGFISLLVHSPVMPVKDSRVRCLRFRV
jgi:hypothetical protein